MEECISRGEYDADLKRLEAEDKRQNERLRALDEDLKQIGTLTSSVNKLATNMELMLKEQEKQGKRLEALEGRDGEKWRTVASYTITVVLGIIMGFLFKQFGIA